MFAWKLLWLSLFSLILIFSSWNLVLCSMNLLVVVKDFLQIRQWENVLPSPWAELRWCLRGVRSVYDLGHILHLKFLWFRWDCFRCRIISDLTPNILEHILQGTLRISSQYLLCPLRLTTDLKHLIHSNFISTPCVFMWTPRPCFVMNIFWQTSHFWVSFEWVALCLFIVLGVSFTCFLHVLQSM